MFRMFFLFAKAASLAQQRGANRTEDRGAGQKQVCLLVWSCCASHVLESWLKSSHHFVFSHFSSVFHSWDVPARKGAKTRGVIASELEQFLATSWDPPLTSEERSWILTW